MGRLSSTVWDDLMKHTTKITALSEPNFAEQIGVPDILDNPSIVSEGFEKQKHGFDFRPLTPEEKKQLLRARSK